MKQKIKYCKNCGKELNEKRKTYCDNKCQKEFEYQQYIQRWKDGLENGVRGEYQVSGHIRRYLFEKYNNKCAICGWSQINLWTNSLPLEVHHIDGNYINNEESNLTLLCPNCHSLTDTYKSANTRGRIGRKKYSN